MKKSHFIAGLGGLLIVIDPDIAPGAWAHWKASRLVEFPRGVAQIVSWTDMVQGLVLRSINSNPRPEYSLTGLHGKPALQFTADDTLGIAFGAGIGKTITVLLIVKTVDNAVMNFMELGSNAVYRSDGGFSMSQRAEGVWAAFQPAYESGDYTDVGTTMQAAAGLAMTLQIDTQAASDVTKVYATNASAAVSGAKNGRGVDIMKNFLTVGASNGANGLNGFVAEIIVYNTRLSPSALQSIRSAKMAEYRLATTDFGSIFQRFMSAGMPNTLTLPVPAGSNGTTVMFMMRLDNGVSGGDYVEYLNANATCDFVLLNSKVSSNSQATGYYNGGFPQIGATSPANFNKPGLWLRWSITSAKLSRNAGNMTFNAYKGLGSSYADIRVYNRVLSGAEIADFNNPPADMLSWYTFANQAALGNAVTDQTGHGYTGTLTY